MTRLLRRALANKLSRSEMESLVSAFDQVGEIIVIRIPESLYPRRAEIGEALLENIKVANRVFCQVSEVEGDYRTRGLELVAGEGGTRTEYRENGCRFVVDVEKVFFTPRLSTERARVAGLVRPGETVLNMFGGAGMFSIQMAKNTACTVYNVDINPEATALCERNAAMNRMAGKVVPVTGDASEIAPEMADMSDRTLMPLPESSDEFLADAVRATRRGGVIHYYTHVHADRKQDAARLSEGHFMDAVPAECRITNSRMVRAVGPRYYQTAVDAIITAKPPDIGKTATRR